MRTATIKIDTRLLFSSIGLNNFYAQIDGISLDGEILTLKISGGDSRIPEGDDYPRGHLIATRIESNIEKIE